MKLSIVIPAHNEEHRIGRTIKTYFDYFGQKAQSVPFSFELIIVLNGCTDGTLAVVREYSSLSNCIIINSPQAGKGHAVMLGFASALERDSDLIGFVDADMATHPRHFFDLITQADDCDGVIASRYMPGAHISPPRPAFKRWGSRIVYEPLIWLLFGLQYYDFQCGAKVFKRAVIKKILPQMRVKQWALDLELLYLCKQEGFVIKEVPTTWVDQEGSKLKPIRSGLHMLWSACVIRFRHSLIGRFIANKKGA